MTRLLVSLFFIAMASVLPFSAESEEEILRDACYQVVEAKHTPTLLEPVSMVVVSAITGKFVATEKFVLDTSREAKVKIGYLDENFTKWFLSGDGKTEDPNSGQTLCRRKLQQSSFDGPIIAKLGGEKKSETTLSDMFSLMEKQGRGQDGVLLNNGWANIFYIKDQNWVLRTVFVDWSDFGWGVSAYPINESLRWGVGRQVFSRNYVL